MNELSNDELVNAGVFQPQAGNAKDLSLFEDIKKLANIQQVKAVVASLKSAVKKPYASIVLKALQVLVSTAREQTPTQAPSIVATAVAATLPTPTKTFNAFEKNYENEDVKRLIRLVELTAGYPNSVLSKYANRAELSEYLFKFIIQSEFFLKGHFFRKQNSSANLMDEWIECPTLFFAGSVIRWACADSRQISDSFDELINYEDWGEAIRNPFDYSFNFDHYFFEELIKSDLDRQFNRPSEDLASIHLDEFNTSFLIKTPNTTTANAAAPVNNVDELVLAGVIPAKNEEDRVRFEEIKRISTPHQVKLAVANIAKKGGRHPYSSVVLTEIYLIISDEIRNRDSSGRAMTNTEYLVHSGVLPPVNEQDDANFKEIMLVSHGDALLIVDAVIDVKRMCIKPYSSAVLLKLKETLGISLP